MKTNSSSSGDRDVPNVPNVETRHALSLHIHLPQPQPCEQHKIDLSAFRADLHIHTLLSPCADLEMTPANIVERAKETGLQIIGVTDHNSTRNAKLVKRLAEKEGIFVLTGAEVTTKEEVHCLVFFQFENELDAFQKIIEREITNIPNPDGHFGYQPVVDEHDNILELVPNYLTAALKLGIEEVQREVEKLDGIFIPAHIDRPFNGIFGQLGFIPPRLKFDALGISKNISKKHAQQHYNILTDISLIRNSDAHFLNQIGEIYSEFHLQEISFEEIRMALNRKNGRHVEIL